MRRVDRPIDDRWCVFAARAPLANSSARPGLADGAAVTVSGHELPAILAGNAGIIVEREERAAVELDDI